MFREPLSHPYFFPIAFDPDPHGLQYLFVLPAGDNTALGIITTLGFQYTASALPALVYLHYLAILCRIPSEG